MGQAREHLEQALHIYQEMGNRLGEEVEDQEGQGKTLRNLGKLYLDQQRYEDALASLLLARTILNEVQSTYSDESQRGIDTLRRVVGDEAFAILLAKVEPRASTIVRRALSVDL